MKCLSIVLSILLLCNGINVSAQTTMENIISELTISDNMLTCGTFEMYHFHTEPYQVQMIPDDDPHKDLKMSIYESECYTNYIYDGDNKYFRQYELTDGKELVRELCAYNGNKTDVLIYEKSQSGLISPKGYIYQGDKTRCDEYDPLGFLTYIPLHKWFEEINNGIIYNEDTGDVFAYVTDVSIEDDEIVINDVNCIVVQITYDLKDKNQTRVHTYWLAPSHLYKPMKIEMDLFVEDGMRAKVIEYIDYQKEGMYLYPKNSKLELYQYDEFTEEFLHVMQRILQVISFVPNTKYSQDYFEVDFPEDLELTIK